MTITLNYNIRDVLPQNLPKSCQRKDQIGDDVSHVTMDPKGEMDFKNQGRLLVS
jgi:hypothetical protein